MSSRSPESERRDGASRADVVNSSSLVRGFPPILWKRNDISSLETCRLVEHSAGWRLGEHEYRYMSADGKFEAPLTVDEQGLVVHYGTYWSRA